MTRAPVEPLGSRHWLRALLFTLILVGLVAVAAGGEWEFDLAALATCAVGFGFFYVVFPGGLHFAITLANFLAVYACIFVFFRDANFHDAPRAPSIVALALPLLAFLGSSFARRVRIAAMIRARRRHELTHLPRLARWVPGTALVGGVSFLLPLAGLGPAGQGAALLVAMAAIAAQVAFAVGDVVLLLIDIALIFEGVARRLDRLVLPMTAFFTLYSLLVVVFACLYRIADMLSAVPQFANHAGVFPLGFGDAIYFSIVTLSTVGYGDIVPHGALARILAGAEVVAGLFLLLFGVSEILRGTGSEGPRGRLPE